MPAETPNYPAEITSFDLPSSSMEPKPAHNLISQSQKMLVTIVTPNFTVTDKRPLRPEVYLRQVFTQSIIASATISGMGAEGN
jgi:hypothetical protein